MPSPVSLIEGDQDLTHLDEKKAMERETQVQVAEVQVMWPQDNERRETPADVKS